MHTPEYLNIAQEQFDRNFSKLQFEITHHLAEHPLFQLPRLLELAREMSRERPSDIYFDLGVTNIGARWDSSTKQFPVDEAIDRIETAGAWIDLKAAERSPPYAKILKGCFTDLLQVSGPALADTIRRREMAIFVTSPNRISTYHIDSESNFLLQLRGEKEISIFPKNDREVLSEEEIERSWTVDTNAAVYKPHLQHRASVVKLKPGVGVHIPVNAPHWVKNGNNVSISVAILHHYWAREFANVYGTNYYLRRFLGVNPTPPFHSAWRDSLKNPTGAILHKLRAWYHGGPIRDPSPDAEALDA